MCTAVSFTTNNHYFGRTLDLEYHYDERVVITPRNYPFDFRYKPAQKSHLAMIGMATVMDGYPLYYEATNECGVSMAGLSFPQTAVYSPFTEGKDNIAPFELIPWVLGQCKNMAQVRALLSRLAILHENFRETLPVSPLHWMISWSGESLVLESTADGLHVYDNPTGVMTNTPAFPQQLAGLDTYQSLSPTQPKNTFAPSLPLNLPSNGMGALGLPGDWSSSSRFIRAVFARMNAACGSNERASVSQFFHILDAVSMPRGCVLVNGKPEITVYASCCNADTGVYYYVTYENRQITAVNMHKEALNGSGLIAYPLITRQQIHVQNG